MGVLAVAFSPDGRYALSGSWDNTTRLWNIETGQEIVQMLSFEDGEWITITPEGYYTASLNGAKYLNVRIGNEVYGIDQFESQFHRPDIVKLAIKLGDTEKAIAQTTRDAKSTQLANIQPPKVWFVSPQDGYKTDRASLEIQVKTEDVADTAEAVTFLVNHRPLGTEKGKPVRPDSPGAKVKLYRRIIPLQVGENWIEVEAQGQAGAVERRILLVIREGSSKPKPDLYYLGIGVANHPQLPLQFPVKDVQGMEKVLKQQEGSVYNRVVTKTLTDAEATRGKLIETVTTFFKPVKPGDIAILFVSGHGMNTPMGYHFLTHDADPDTLMVTGVPWTVFNHINTLKAHVLLLVDTCRAGAISGNDDWRKRAEVDPAEFLRQANLYNVFIFAASSGDAVSWEDPAWGHGAFTKALIEGLEGEAAYPGNSVKLIFLQDYVHRRVNELTDGSQQPTIPRSPDSGKFLDLVLATKRGE